MSFLSFIDILSCTIGALVIINTIIVAQGQRSLSGIPEDGKYLFLVLYYGPSSPSQGPPPANLLLELSEDGTRWETLDGANIHGGRRMGLLEDAQSPPHDDVGPYSMVQAVFLSDIERRFKYLRLRNYETTASEVAGQSHDIVAIRVRKRDLDDWRGWNQESGRALQAFDL